MIPRNLVDSRVSLTIVRDRVEQEILVPTRTSPQMLLRSLGNDYPAYFILGPMAFVPAYADMVQASGAEGILAFLAEESPFALRAQELPAFPGEELVFALPTLFDHAMTTGYAPPQYWVVQFVNDTRIRNLRHLVECLRDSTDPYLRFTFYGRKQESLVFDRTRMIHGTEQVLEDDGIRRQASEELLALWNEPTPPRDPDANASTAEPGPPEAGRSEHE